MSEFHINASAIPIPPTVPTSFTTDSGTGVPVANILQMHGYDSSENNIFGITSKGGVNAGNPPGTGAVNEVDYYLTNRIHGTGTTVDDVTPVTLFNFNLGAIPGVYNFSGSIIGYNTTDALATVNTYFFAVRTNGVAGTEIPPTDTVSKDDTTMENCLITYQVLGNIYSVIVNGLAGKNINWQTVTTYNFVS